MRTLLFALALPLLAQSGEVPKEATKPADAIIAAYFKADAAVGATRAQHDALMENIKKSVADSVAKQVNAMIQAVIASSQLHQSCPDGQAIDDQALLAAEVKCVDKPKAPAK